MNLLIDIGNTRVKWACAEDNVLTGHNAFAYTRETLTKLLPAHWDTLARPQQVHVSSVADDHTNAMLGSYARATWKREPQHAVSAREQHGLRNAYQEVTTMGVDRWLAMLAAWRKHQRPLCVIDCGTAVTIDVVLGDGRHAGGFILPGLALTTAALARETYGIPDRQEQELRTDYGRSTAACISNGFAAALVGLLQNCAGKVREEQHTELLFIATGGAAAQLIPLLPKQTLHEPHLVLEGLIQQY